MPYSETTFRSRQREEANDPAGPSQTYADSVYDELRDAALATISRAAPADLSASVSTTNGSANIPLPSDFVTLQTAIIEPDGYPRYRLTTSGGQIMVEGEGQDNIASDGYFGFISLPVFFHVYGQNIVLASPATATQAWTLLYGGEHTLATLSTAWVDMALDYAMARFFDRKAAAAAEFFKYSLSSGSVDVDKSGESKRWHDLRDARMASFEARLKEVATITGTTATFTWHRA